MTGEHSAGHYGHSLAEALSTLDTGPEPPMPDLVPAAITRGTRIRRRRRIAVALSTTAMTAAMAAVAIGGYTALTPAQQSPHPLPASKPSIWYPSPTLLRTIISPKTGTIDALRSQRSTGPYVRLTDRTGLVTDLYVAITRSTTSPLFPLGPGDCQDSSGRVLTTPWGGPLFKCAVIRADSGDRLLEYYMDRGTLPDPINAAGDSAAAWGAFYQTSGGWTVQVIANPLNKDRPDMTGRVPNKRALTELATDPRLFDAVTETRD